MYTPSFQITPLILKNIEEIGHVFGYLKAIQLPQSYRQEYIEKIAAETVHASTAIEGNTLTQDQVEKVMKGEPIKAIQRDIREAKNYFRTLEFIRDVGQQTEVFTQQTVLELHHKLLSGVDDEIAGKYRTTQVRVGDYLPPEARRVPSLMAEFVEWLNIPMPQGLSPVLYAGIAHYQLVAAHPFRDGNGRTTRAFVTLYLMKNNYDVSGSFALESYYNRERKNYYNALSSVDRSRTENNRPDLTKWLEYFTTGFLVEAERAQSRMSEFLTTQKLMSSVSLTNTQKTLLKVTARKGIVQMANYLEKLSMSPKGVYNALQKLVELELIERVGERKGSRYTITEKGLRFGK